VCAITGIAGPDGGNEYNPVGTVFIAVKFLERVIIEKCYFIADRDGVRLRAIETAIFMILKIIGEN
jgi:nicotinamide-nucleotide amidase